MTEVYRRYSIEDLRKFYLKGESALLVFTEYRTFFYIMFSNEDAFDYLQENGINVILDEQTSTDHMKLLIIDEKITYIGSHNWSESSLYYNTETSVKIVNQNFATALREYVSDITGF